MFKDRKDAAYKLSKELLDFKGDKNALIIAIPRGGVVLGHELSRLLDLPLDIIVIKKIGHPNNEELALGAVSLDEYFINEDVSVDVPKSYIDQKVKEKNTQIKKRYEFLKGEASSDLGKLKGKIILLVDDGIATGATMSMAIRLIKRHDPKKIVIAVPVAAEGTCQSLSELDSGIEVISIIKPVFFVGIGQFYEDFSEVTDEEVKKLLDDSKK